MLISQLRLDLELFPLTYVKSLICKSCDQEINQEILNFDKVPRNHRSGKLCSAGEASSVEEAGRVPRRAAQAHARPSVLVAGRAALLVVVEAEILAQIVA